MSLSRKIAAGVEDRLGLDPLPRLVTASEGAHSLDLQLSAAGPVGLAFDALEFHGADPDGDLRARADRLAARLDYLMEPLAVVEHDGRAGEVLLRSRKPTRRAGWHAYYEARLGRDGSTRLGRVRFDDQTRQRRPTPCQITAEALERLVDDLVAVAG